MRNGSRETAFRASDPDVSCVPIPETFRGRRARARRPRIHDDPASGQSSSRTVSSPRSDGEPSVGNFSTQRRAGAPM
jgi:hypothetical protein